MRVYTRAVAVFAIALLLPAAASADDLGIGQSDSKTAPVKSAVHVVAERIVSRIEGAFPNDASNKPAVWWKKLFSI